MPDGQKTKLDMPYGMAMLYGIARKHVAYQGRQGKAKDIEKEIHCPFIGIDSRNQLVEMLVMGLYLVEKQDSLYCN